MREVFIVGVGMTPFGVHADLSVGEMARRAVSSALADAGALPDDIEATFYANTAQGAIEGQHGIKGQHALRPMGIQGGSFVNVENACTGGSTAFNLAFAQVAGGFADVALAVGSEKLNTDDKAKKLATFGQPEDLAQVTAFVEGHLGRVVDILPPPDAVIDERIRSIFMDAYAVNARLHMKKYGTTWRQIAAVAAKNHHHSTMNPLAQFQKDFTIEQVLAGRIIAWPLTLPMCAPVSDGAAAVVLCSKEALSRFDGAGPVRVLGSVLRAGVDRDLEDIERSALRRAARAAFDMAGLTPADISVAEVHDASAYAEINQVEMSGLIEVGQGGVSAEAGETSLGGRIPVNPSGGLESKGHPVAATGLGQLYELTLQLRGEAGGRTVANAHTAMACCSGGFWGVEDAASCVTILTRV
ncbi:MAG: thiolase family protein [Caulobacteraceae bacterium]